MTMTQPAVYICAITIIVNIAVSEWTDTEHTEPKCYSRFDYDIKLVRNLVQLEESNNNLKETTTIMQKELQEMKSEGKAIPSTVAVMAQLSANTLVPAHGDVYQAIIFDKIETNVGNAYNEANGIFTVPVDGVYHFNLELSIPNGRAGQVLHVTIQKNGQRAGYMFFVVDANLWLRRTTAVTLQLQCGDMVRAIVVFSQGTVDNVIAGCCFHSHFSGFLVGL